jgi:transposase
MARKFKTVDYEKTLDTPVTLREVLPPDHLARFIVGIIALLDLSGLYAAYGPRGGEAYAPEILLGLLFYGYATGVFSSRGIEKATSESLPFRFIAGGLHPDHDTIADFRKRFLPQIKELLVQVLLVAHELGELQLGNISVDGSKLRADASKHHAVSYGRLLELEQQLREEVEELMALSEQADSQAAPEGMNVATELALRHARLANLEQAKAVLEARAGERYQAEQAEYEAKVAERAAKEQERGRKLGGRPPQPPEPGPRDKDQYNFTDPESQVMKNSTDKGFDQHYNAQAAVDQESRMIVGCTVSAHANDQEEALPTVDAIPAAVGTPEGAALDNGFFSEDNIKGLEERHIEPSIATGREPHQHSWKAYFAEHPEEPGENASVKEKMAYKLRTEIGREIYRLRKSTVEPVIGIIKETMGFRQFSLRGLAAVAGEWNLVCLAYDLRRLHVLQGA